MHSTTLGMRVAAFVFGLMTLAQLLRLVIQPEVIVAGYLIPLWPSLLAVLILGALCFWLWDLSKPMHH